MNKSIICKNCNKYEKYLTKGYCSKCYDKEYRIKHKERIRIQRKQYRLKNKDKIKESNKSYRLKNFDKIKATKKKWADNNPEKLKIIQKRWDDKNPDKVKLKYKRYRKTHKEQRRKYRAEHKEQRATYYIKNKEGVNKQMRIYKKTPAGKLAIKRALMKRRVGGEVKKGDISKLLNENIFKYGIITCEKCKEQCPYNYHIDHIIPVSKGGGNNYNNFQILCACCNLIKQTKIANYKKELKNNQLILREAQNG
jgi:5-methylcytosine-specific restriction endonuclease McrA